MDTAPAMQDALAAGPDYRVDLEIFRGPLDLLLFLVRRNEVDICDIPIATITDQYLQYLRLLQAVDVDLAGDFLVMASTLMEIKSRMLLPQGEQTADADDDPRRELVRQLLEYRKFKDAAALLEERAQAHAARFQRVPTPPCEDDPAQQPIKPVELWDLASALSRLLRETQATSPRAIVYDETPIQVYMDEVAQRLGDRGRLTFSELFAGQGDRGRVIGLFLALLELVRAGRIRAEQNDLFAEIWILPMEGRAAEDVEA